MTHQPITPQHIADELHRMSTLPVVQADDEQADSFSTGARWAIRMVYEILDGTRSPADCTRGEK